MVSKFEDLDCWKVARELVAKVYMITNADSCRKDFGYVDQIRAVLKSFVVNKRRAQRPGLQQNHSVGHPFAGGVKVGNVL